MAIIGNTMPTLLELSKLYGEGGNPLPMAEMLHQRNEALDDIPWEEANSTTGHRISARSGLPAVAWRKLNGGVPPTVGGFADVTESMGMLSALGQADKALVELSGNPAHFRMTQNAGHFEAMGQEWARTLFYGDTDVSPEKFLGLAPRFDDITGPNNAEQIIDAGGTGTDNSSIWLVGWGHGSVMGVYPKGTQAGLQHTDYGIELTSDGAGGQFPAYRDWFEWKGGIAVYDWRNIVRIANIDNSLLTKDGTGGSADLIDLMVQAQEQLNSESGVNPVFYVPRRIRSFLRRQITNKDNVYLSLGEVAGRKVVQFDGVPVRRMDALLSNEARIV